MQDRDVITTDH